MLYDFEKNVDVRKVNKDNNEEACFRRFIEYQIFIRGSSALRSWKDSRFICHSTKCKYFDFETY